MPDYNPPQITGPQFEAEVMRIARLIWPEAAYDGPLMVDDRERDGVFVTEENIHVIECTMLRTKAKATQDCDKLAEIIRKQLNSNSLKGANGWFITLEEPTADQRSEALRLGKRSIKAVSLKTFRSKLIDPREYMALRNQYAFGSVRDPETAKKITSSPYIPLTLIEAGEKTHKVDHLHKLLLKGRTVVLLGDYGAGKSSTLRHVYGTLGDQYRLGQEPTFPMLLNLRDHHGQTDPVEAIERHAKLVGLPESKRSMLVRAWRGGYATVMLDGFDEIATAGWAGKSGKLRDLRFRSMQLIRAFVGDTPEGTGIVVAGREHFFDNADERTKALGIGDSSAQTFGLSEFTPDQVQDYLALVGVKAQIPDWFPTRPLLLTYLSSSKLLDKFDGIDQSADVAEGWNALFDRICRRESDIDQGMDGDTVRRLIEGLATRARNTLGGMGPISADIITASFKSVCGYEPDDRGMAIIQRLPGLGGTDLQDGSRAFIDPDFLAVATAGDLSRFITSPYTEAIQSRTWLAALQPLAADVTAYLTKDLSDGHAFNALREASRPENNNGTLAADVLTVMLSGGRELRGDPLTIHGAQVDRIELGDDSPACDHITMVDSALVDLYIHTGTDQRRIPRFQRCLISNVHGVGGASDVLNDRFEDCEINSFSKTSSGSDVMDLDIPSGAKVMLKSLRKLFRQKGTGRKDSAMYKGIEPGIQYMVPSVLEILKKHGFVEEKKVGGDMVWIPLQDPGVRRRARHMLDRPTTSDDQIMHDARLI